MKSLLLSVCIALGSLGEVEATTKFSYSVTEPELADGRVLGRILDASNNQPVDYASVTVKSLEDSTFITGGLTADGGKFNVADLKPGKYEVVVTFMGYETYKKEILIESKQKSIDLGSILIKPSDNALETVEISTKKSDMMVGIDRKVFDVEKNAITTGGTALDVLRQIPTLQVDMDGNITLRGSDQVTIFMNGKNTGISAASLPQVLKSMPASSIKSVELITNPSAKYDAAGMSGIVNIITKKNVVPGNFGSATVSIGNDNKYNANGSYNYSIGKLSTSTSFGINSNMFTHTAFNKRNNFIAGESPFSINNYRTGKQRNDGYSLNGNADYTFSEKSVLSFNYYISNGRGFLNETNNYEFLDSARTAYNRFSRTSDNHYINPNIDFGLSWTKQFDTEKKNELVLSANWAEGTFDDKQSYLQQQQTVSGESNGAKPYDQHINQTSHVFDYTLQADYTKQVGETGKIEAGLKSNIRLTDDTYIADSLNYATGNREQNNAISNLFTYDQIINAAYLNYSRAVGKFGVQGGLRAEQTMLSIYQKAVGPDAIKRDYTSFFPSLFINRKFEKAWESQISYSRRINRPYPQFLNPFPDFTDPLNIRTGNAYLNPEYLNAYEASLMKYWGRNSITVTGYYRDIRSAFQRIREVAPSGVSTVTLNNFGKAVNMGTEIVGRVSVTPWWTNTVNLNLYRTILQGQTAVRDYATDAFNWNVRLMSSIRFLKNADAQISANYNAPYRIPQGRYYGFSGVDVGARKEILAGRAAIGFSVQDVFNTRKFKVNSSDFNYSAKSEFKRESRWVTVNFTWNFGQTAQGQQRRKQILNPGGGGGNMNMGL